MDSLDGERWIVFRKEVQEVQRLEQCCKAGRLILLGAAVL